METENLKLKKLKDLTMESEERIIKIASENPVREILLKEVKRNMKKYLANEKKYYKIKKNYEEHLAKGGPKNESLEESLKWLKEVTE